MLIRFWLNYFGKGRFDVIPIEIYTELLENLVRGKEFKDPTPETKLFAKTYMRMLENAGCLDINKGLKRDILQQSFEDESVDIYMLSSSLGAHTLKRRFEQY